eukprot:jgi/Undpi1/880/HiC_scaffold_10.g04344.m1
MSESVVFELKLQIQHLEEKLTFLAGGTNGAELVEVVMEKDEELERNHKSLKDMETKMFQLAESAKRVDSQRRELMRHKEQLAVRVQLIEAELARQADQSVELRKQVVDAESVGEPERSARFCALGVQISAENLYPSVLGIRAYAVDIFLAAAAAAVPGIPHPPASGF